MSKQAGWASEYQTMINDCEQRESRITDWERGYLDSLRAWIEDGRRPSEKQIERLDAIWEKATARG